MKTRLIGGIVVPFDAPPIFPGGGICKTKEDVMKLVRNPDIPIIEYGSVTVLERFYNPGTTWFVDGKGRFSGNSLGIPNLGREKLRQLLPELITLVHKEGKKFTLNLAGINGPRDYIDLITLGHALRV